MFTAIVLAFFVFPALAWSMRLACRLLGWTLRAVACVVLLPLWIVAFLLGGIAIGLKVIAPIAIVLAILSMLVPEN